MLCKPVIIFSLLFFIVIKISLLRNCHFQWTISVKNLSIIGSPLNNYGLNAKYCMSNEFNFVVTFADFHY